MKERFRLINDHFQNYKPYAIPKAQLVIGIRDFGVSVSKLRENGNMTLFDIAAA